jgi:hypothetical protein
MPTVPGLLLFLTEMDHTAADRPGSFAMWFHHPIPTGTHLEVYEAGTVTRISEYRLATTGEVAASAVFRASP